MNLLLNQGLPRSAAHLLSQSGHPAVHVGEIGLAAAEDIEILEHARREDQIIITLDADYHRYLATSGLSKPSVIRIRIEGLRAEPLCELIGQVLPHCADALAGGAMITVGPARVRVRKLPLRNR